MKQKTIYILRYTLGILLFVLGAFLADQDQNVPALILFSTLGIGESILAFLETRRLLDLRLLLSMSWLLGIGLSCLKLSALQSKWTLTMWVICGLFYFLLLFGYDLVSEIIKRKKKKQRYIQKAGKQNSELLLKRVYQAIWIVFILGMVSFLVESVYFKFHFPLISQDADAYTSFHITGIHYFVVSLMFVPTLSVIYGVYKRPEKKELLILTLLVGMCLLVPVLTLSKFQILLTLAMPLFTWVLIQDQFSRTKVSVVILVAGVLLAVAFAFLVLNRSYPEGYLKRIFRFNDRNTSMAVQYPYIYITNNFENLNLLTDKLQVLSFGKRLLYPFAALTGLKFLPSMESFLCTEVYLTRGELTTVTILYDAFGDFGVIGVGIFGILIGMFSGWISMNVHKRQTVLGSLLYGQLAIYLGLSFFTTWFSNPTTLFWLIMTFMIALWCTKEEHHFKFHISRIQGELKHGTKSRN